ncbi:transcription factor Dp [Anopheles bellator]|uniref:transcription factor Dp n=1 Tax=Anopheles bellator TaxID=139047 RepID=UPI00264A337F|nr:transcription factor Dp [Anopheles bellator]XP_058055007.1 transcription factor Dp [Anopheles bellator]XP_058055008.1 transcription factor Dp [Anopheles bellator]
MAHHTKPVNFVIQDTTKQGQQHIFHVLNTATGTRTTLPATSVTAVKTIVTKDLSGTTTGTAVHGQDTMNLMGGTVVAGGGLAAVSATTSTNVPTASAVIGGQSFTMPMMRKLPPGVAKKLITVPKHKLILPQSSTQKTVNGKTVVHVSPKLYKVISASSPQSASRNLTFAAPANLTNLQGVASTSSSSTVGNNGTTIAIPSTSAAMSQSSFGTSYSTGAPMMTSVGVGNRVIIGGSSIVGGDAGDETDDIAKASPPVKVVGPKKSAVYQKTVSDQPLPPHQVQQHSYSKKAFPRQTIHNTPSRRRKTDKAGRGLRHFSMKVCEKVQAKGTTTYNEVANELVAEETQNNNSPVADPATYDQKNIRRRVYDALNVLMAMKIISKEKKEIRWHGLPTSTSITEYDDLEKENEKARRRIEEKQQQFRDLVQQHVALKSLIARNQANEERGLVPNHSAAVQLPFIVVNTDRKTNINCNMTNDKSEYSFKFEDTFEIHDDLEILKRMGLSLGLESGQCSEADLKEIKSMVPQSVAKYIEKYGLGLDEEDGENWEMSSIYNGQDNDDSLSTQDMLGYHDNTNDMLDDDMKFEDDEDD